MGYHNAIGGLEEAAVGTTKSFGASAPALDTVIS